MTFKKEAEHLGPDQESGEWSKSEGDSEEENLFGESEEWEDDSEKSGDDQDSLCMILAEEKMRHQDTELQTDSSAGTYRLEQQDAYVGEELEKMVVSRKPFRVLSCNSNVKTKLEPDYDREVLRRIVCVKLKDDIHSPGELNGQMTEPKWTEPDQPITTGTRKGVRKRAGMRYKRYGDDFLIDKIQPDEISEELVNMGELVVDEEWQIINDSEHWNWIKRKLSLP